MGDSDAAVVGSGGKIKQIKKKGWRYCGCGTLFIILGIIFFVSGVALLAAYSSALSSGTKDANYAAAVVGVIFILLSVLVLLLGACFCTCVFIIYRKMTKKPGGKHYEPPSYEYGKAPYPQQDWGNNAGTGGQVQQQQQQPGAPPAQPTAPAGPDVVDPGTIVADVK